MIWRSRGDESGATPTTEDSDRRPPVTAAGSRSLHLRSVIGGLGREILAAARSEQGIRTPLEGLVLALIVAIPMIATAIALAPEVTLPVPSVNDDMLHYLFITNASDDSLERRQSLRPLAATHRPRAAAVPLLPAPAAPRGDRARASDAGRGRPSHGLQPRPLRAARRVPADGVLVDAADGLLAGGGRSVGGRGAACSPATSGTASSTTATSGAAGACTRSSGRCTSRSSPLRSSTGP